MTYAKTSRVLSYTVAEKLPDPSVVALAILGDVGSSLGTTCTSTALPSTGALKPVTVSATV
jgi:hypothetical protein